MNNTLIYGIYMIILSVFIRNHNVYGEEQTTNKKSKSLP